MGRERIETILQAMATNGDLDPRIVRLLQENMEDIRRSVKEAQDQAWERHQERRNTSKAYEADREVSSA